MNCKIWSQNFDWRLPSYRHFFSQIPLLLNACGGNLSWQIFWGGLSFSNLTEGLQPEKHSEIPCYNLRTLQIPTVFQNGLWRLLSRLWERVYQPPLQAKSLRRKCSGITTKPGQEIAHKLSLYLAAHLWRHTNGGRRRYLHYV